MTPEARPSRCDGASDEPGGAAANGGSAGALLVRPISPGDAPFIRSELIRNWCATEVWSRDRRFDADQLPGFVALLDDRPAGHLTFAVAGDVCEVVTLASVVEGRGVGSALLAAAVEEARRCGCRRMLLTTTNDNLNALGFYQRRGWRIVAVHPGAIDRARRHKPQIPRVGMYGIPLRDEIELEFNLDSGLANLVSPRVSRD